MGGLPLEFWDDSVLRAVLEKGFVTTPPVAIAEADARAEVGGVFHCSVPRIAAQEHRAEEVHAPRPLLGGCVARDSGICKSRERIAEGGV